MNLLCTICARGGSKGVKNKNIRLLNGKPLIAYTILQAKSSKLFSNIVISTDSDEIASVAIKYGGEVFFKRDKELSNDNASKLDVIKDACIKSENYYNKKFDYIVDLDVTSPLRDVEDIRNSFEQFLKNDNDNLITVMPSRRSPYFNLIEIIDNQVKLSKEPPNKIVRRQDVPKTYDMNASIYIWKRDALLKNDTLFLDKTGLYIMPEERSIDIDSEFELFQLLRFRKKSALFAP